MAAPVSAGRFVYIGLKLFPSCVQAVYAVIPRCSYASSAGAGGSSCGTRTDTILVTVWYGVY